MTMSEELKKPTKKELYAQAKNDPDLKGFTMKKKWILYCLKLSKGLVSVACENAGLSRRAFYDWYSKMVKGVPNPSYDEAFHDMVEEIRMVTHEYVESKLLQNIDRNDEKAIEYYLSNNYKEKYTSVNQKVDVTTKGESLNKGFYDFLKEVSQDDDE